MTRSTATLGALMVVLAVPALCRQDGSNKPAAKPEAAQKMLDGALKTAAKQKKPVFVLFDASW